MEKNKFEIKVKINQSKQKKTQSGVGGGRQGNKLNQVNSFLHQKKIQI